MTIKHIRDTAANLTSDNPTLGAGEWGFESDTGLAKVGDGSTAWTSLDYYTQTSLFIPAATLTAWAGSPTLQNGDAQTPNAIWLLNQSTDEGVTGIINIPTGWATADLYLWTQNHNGTAANDVIVDWWVWTFADADLASTPTTASNGTGVTCSITGTLDTLDRHSLTTGASLVGAAARFTQLIIRRDADNVSDDYASDIGVVGLELVRAT